MRDRTATFAPCCSRPARNAPPARATLESSSGLLQPLGKSRSIRARHALPRSLSSQVEYDDARSGDFAPLRFVPKSKRVVLGLVSSKRAQLEDKTALQKRIDEAARFLSLDQLCLSPQCGFSSTVHGNDVSEQVERDKLRLVHETASEVWGAA